MSSVTGYFATERERTGSLAVQNATYLERCCT